MNFARCEAIAKAVLYEGYNLYPYRPSALKNRRRWTFGGVFPRAWAAQAPDDRDCMQTQCLLRGGADAVLEVRVCLLHIVARDIEEPAPGGFRKVDALEVDGAPLLAWEEAKKREIVASGLSLARLAATPARLRFAVAAEREIEPVGAADGHVAARIVRTVAALDGALVVAAEAVAGDVWRLTVSVENMTPLADGLSREAAQRLAFAPTHILVGVERGAFLSLLDPPPALAEAAAGCDNRGCWPVLVGEDGATDIMLAAPIILYDYPKIAPESPGDLFEAEGIGNFSLFCNHITIVPTIKAVLDSPDMQLDGFLGPGHVSMVVGAAPFRFVAERYGKPLVISGFEPLDILQSIWMVLQQLAEGRCEIENQYARIVPEAGNSPALRAVAQIYELREFFEWRGLGSIDRSGVRIRERYAAFDAERKFGVPNARIADPKSCQCGEVLKGVIKPWQCKVFGTACTPEQPLGALMVSSEGACAAYYQYGGVRRAQAGAA